MFRNTTIYVILKSTQPPGSQGQVTVQITTAADTTKTLSSFLLTMQVVQPTALPNGLSRLKKLFYF